MPRCEALGAAVVALMGGVSIDASWQPVLVKRSCFACHIQTRLDAHQRVSGPTSARLQHGAVNTADMRVIPAGTQVTAAVQPSLKVDPSPGHKLTLSF